MPNFITHWLVADQCIGKWTGEIPPYIKSGREAYVVAVRKMGKALTTALKNIKTKEDYKKFKKIEKDERNILKNSFQGIILTFDNALKGIKEINGKKVQDNAVRDDITCFSAYMLGACGPDFWTVPSKGGATFYKTLASHHFDMGHYNRTHMVFKNFVYRLAKDKAIFPNRESIQAKVATSYFMGLATHFAADLTIHPLVNVSAGAYGLLEKNWESEKGALSKAINLWNTHNKVEHYWDAYLRYRIFSDLGPIWKVNNGADQPAQLRGAPAPEQRDEKLWDGFSPLNFPILTTLLDRIDKGNPQKESLEGFLNDKENRWQYEKCYNFPHVFCDRMLARDGLQMFLYDIVVDKKHGAYPRELMYSEACNEAIHSQFDDANGVTRETGKMITNKKTKTLEPEMTKTGKNEKMKLVYFSSEKNKKNEINSINYLNYFILPELENVRRYGWQMFYDLTALPKFINAAVNTAQKFLGPLKNAVDTAVKTPERIQNMHSIPLGALEGFWNLDTGMGLRILKDEGSHTTREVNTVLDFKHILNEATRSAIGHNVDYAYTGRFDRVEYGGNPSRDGVNVFKVYGGENCIFEDILKVNEKEEYHLDKIRVENPVPSNDTISTSTKGQNNQKSENTVMHPMWNRLNLTIRGYMPDFQNRQEKMAFYFRGDKNKTFDSRQGTLGGYSLGDKFIREWLTETSHSYDFFTTDKDNIRDGVEIFKRGVYDLCQFDTHFLATVEAKDDAMGKILSEKKWCIVVSDTLRSLYGRNFAVGTGRERGLHPNGSGSFRADTQFQCYSNVSPTEFVYFSVHPLVEHKPGDDSKYMDIITEKEIKKSDIEKELIKINWMGFVKIVLIYEYVKGRDEGVQLKEYYIDGCKFNREGRAQKFG